MTTIKHRDTYCCDICGREFDVRREVNVLVMWLTEQDSGERVEPYVGQELMDVCDECIDRVVAVEAEGAQGVNSYRFRER